MKSFTEYLLELSLQKADNFQKNAHQGQTRKTSGEPYSVHPTAVYQFLVSLGIKDRNLLVAAYLHDTIEDSPTSFNDIKKEFNQDVARIVKALSSSDKGIQALGKASYLAKKMIAMDPDVLVIKLADRWHNTTDMNSLPKDKAEKYMAQTDYIIQELESSRRLNKTHKKIIKQIEKNMKNSGYKTITV